MNHDLIVIICNERCYDEISHKNLYKDQEGRHKTFYRVSSFVLCLNEQALARFDTDAGSIQPDRVIVSM